MQKLGHFCTGGCICRREFASRATDRAGSYEMGHCFLCPRGYLRSIREVEHSPAGIAFWQCPITKCVIEHGEHLPVIFGANLLLPTPADIPGSFCCGEVSGSRVPHQSVGGFSSGAIPYAHHQNEEFTSLQVHWAEMVIAGACYAPRDEIDCLVIPCLGTSFEAHFCYTQQQSH